MYLEQERDSMQTPTKTGKQRQKEICLHLLMRYQILILSKSGHILIHLKLKLMFQCKTASLQQPPAQTTL